MNPGLTRNGDQESRPPADLKVRHSPTVSGAPRRTVHRLAERADRSRNGRVAKGDAPRFVERSRKHIEPGIVEGPKMILGYLAAGGAGAYALTTAWQHIKARGPISLLAGTAATTALVFGFFQVLPHYPVGVSEVHLILGSTLFLIFGAAPAAFGLAFGLLIQGLFFAPFDLPQYGMNITTLLVPLFALQFVAHRVIAPKTPYVELKYRQALALSTTYQAGIVSWVAFWALYGGGFSGATVARIATFGVAYLAVIVIEPLADLAVLAGAKAVHQLKDTALLERRLYSPA